MASDPPARLRAAKALLASGADEQALGANEWIIQDLQGAPDIASRELDAEAGAEALRSVFARFSLDAEDEAIELAHGVFARFDGSGDPDIRESLRDITTAFRQDGRSLRLVRRPPRS